MVAKSFDVFSNGGNAPTIAACLARAQASLTASDSPRLDAELLLSHVLQKPRSYLFAWPEREIERRQLAVFETLLQKRRQGEPIAYILGYKEFWSLPLAVNESTLIPRPETELLVETVLELLSESDGTTPRSILDLGTGTGAIALALAHERPHWRVIAVDKNPDAVALALNNKQRLGINNVAIYQSDWFGNVTHQGFDAIVTNPPYIDVEDSHLRKGDVQFEPRSALIAQDNGYANIKRLADQSRKFLRDGGWFITEHGFAQAATVRNILASLDYSSVETRQDLASNDRLTLGRHFDVSNVVK